MFAGAVLITDGQTHDSDALSVFPAPVHVLLTGRPGEWDRRLVLETAPAFGIVGDVATMEFRVEALGAAPDAARGTAKIRVSVDGALVMTRDIPMGESVRLDLPIEHGGQNVISLEVPTLEGELTDRNNAASSSCV